jgi:release factor glutamine methyltransferase
MASIRDLLSESRTLQEDTARLEAEVLLADVLNKPRSYLYAHSESEPLCELADKYRELLARRGRGEPLAYLTGFREFWSLKLSVDQHTLIPRPETELLVEWGLELDLPSASRMLDLGTGSGALALALATERPQWQVAASDSSSAALAVAVANAARLGLDQVKFLTSNWYESIHAEEYDLIVSNPPYIDAEDEHLLQGDVRFEPRTALVAEDHGLADLALIVRGARDYLCSGGWLLLEHGMSQGSLVRELLSKAGYTSIATRTDLAGLERATGGQLIAGSSVR